MQNARELDEIVFLKSSKSQSKIIYHKPHRQSSLREMPTGYTAWSAFGDQKSHGSEQQRNNVME